MANTTWSTTDKTAGVTLSGTNNLVLTCTASTSQFVRTIDRNITGKYYWEYTFTTITGTMCCGVANQSVTLANIATTGSGTANLVLVLNNGGYWVNGVSQTGLGAFAAAGVACFALDLGARQVWVRNGAAGNWNANAANNPATGVGGIAVPIFGVGIPAYGLGGGINANTTGSITANFGDTAFTGTPPSGYTSGFTSGASPTLNAVATQIAIEEWTAVATGSTTVVLTQMALEQWATVALASATQQARAIVLA